jgi:hypothetical protein
MTAHGISAEELAAHIQSEIGGERARVADAVSRFVAGGQPCLAVTSAIIELAVQRRTATVH